MDKLISDFLNQKMFAVAGSFRNESKYAYKILRNLENRGYEVFPVNPGVDSVFGRHCYKCVSEIPVLVDVVNLVTPPSATEMIVKECLQKGVNRVWLQPGAESRNAIDFCRNNNMKVIYGVCVMLEKIKP